MASVISKISLSLCLLGCSQQFPLSKDRNKANDHESVGASSPDEQGDKTVNGGETPIPENADYSVSVSAAPDAGGQTSGGGPGIVCRESDKSLRSVEPLDLYEGKILRGLVYPPWEGTRDEILAQWTAAFSFHETIKRDLPQAIAHIKSVWQELPEDVTIQASPDIWGDSAVVMPSGCTIELIGFYQKDGKLRVSPSLYKALTPMQQAAFLMHEAAYYLARRFPRKSANEASSAEVRELIALLAAKSAELRGQSEILTWWDGYFPLFLTKGAAPEILVQVDNPSGLDGSISTYCNDPVEQPSYRIGKKTTVRFSQIEQCKILRISIDNFSRKEVDSKASKNVSAADLNFRIIYGERILKEGKSGSDSFDEKSNRKIDWSGGKIDFFPIYFD